MVNTFATHFLQKSKIGADWNRQERLSVSKHAEARLFTSLKIIINTILTGKSNFAMAA